jgi:SAM-dependent methyltransferase
MARRPDARLWTDRSWLQEVEYRTDANLAARQSIYAYQRPRLNLPAWALGLVTLTGAETVADVGCGNGTYLAELARRGHAGPLVGVDLSAGMLHAARRRAPHVALIAGDAAALPLRDGASGLTLAMHMLYHVPDPGAAVRELRRITRPAGRALVVLNGHDHFRELREVMAAALPGRPAGQPLSFGDRLRLDRGAQLLTREFTTVVRHDVTSELLIPGPQPLEDYVRSMITTQALPDPGRFAAAVVGQLPRSQNGIIRIRAHSGCLICS